MPHKYKNAGAAAEASSSSNSGDIAQPPRPEVQLRRSGRRIAQPNDQEDKTREIQAKVLGHKPADKGMLYQYSDESDERTRQTREGVQLAISGLATMERRLKLDTQTQKQKIARSNVAKNLEPPDPNESDAETDSVRTMILREAENPKHKHLRPSKTEQKVSRGRQIAKKPELIPVDEVSDAVLVDSAEPDTVDSAERGAARPPPVNSSRLPLPWKGRLGYVRTPWCPVTAPEALF